MATQKRPSTLDIALLSDSTFGRGEGTAGVVDTEVEYDDFGMPFIGGKTIRGLLRDSWLSMCGPMCEVIPALTAAAERVLGRSRSFDERCRLRIGDAHLSDTIRDAVRAAVAPGNARNAHLSREAILAAFTSIRYQTAEDRKTGAPAETTLRASRVVLREFSFQARLRWLHDYQPGPEDLQVLALCALATRHGGLLRNRGRGHIRVTLDGDREDTLRYAQGHMTRGDA